MFIAWLRGGGLALNFISLANRIGLEEREDRGKLYYAILLGKASERMLSFYIELFMYYQPRGVRTR